MDNTTDLENWTPGPWVLSDADGRLKIYGESDIVLNKNWSIYPEENIKMRADAQLMATAPELYDSHDNLIDAIEKLISGTPVRDLDERLLYAERVKQKAVGVKETVVYIRTLKNI